MGWAKKLELSLDWAWKRGKSSGSQRQHRDRRREGGTAAGSRPRGEKKTKKPKCGKTGNYVCGHVKRGRKSTSLEVQEPPQTSQTNAHRRAAEPIEEKQLGGPIGYSGIHGRVPGTNKRVIK